MQLQDQKMKMATILSSSTSEAEKIDELAKVLNWFRPEENSAYYAIIQAYVSGAVDLKTTTQQLFSTIDEKIARRQLDDLNFLDLWYSLLHAVRRSPFHPAYASARADPDAHRRATDLVGAFRSHKVAGHDEFNYLYSALTDLTLACREAYNDAPSAADASEVEINAWTNLNYFYACVSASGACDLSIHGLWSMRAALENEQEDDEEGTAVQKYNVLVPAAAAWVFGMGRALYTKEVDLTPSDRKQGNPARGGELWKGMAGFSKERWALWKERLAVISKMEGVSDKTRDTSREAIEAMERAESLSGSPQSASAGL